MTKEEYLNLPFKYDGNSQPVLIKEIWCDLPRKIRREIERKLKKGLKPDITNYLYYLT